MRRVLALIVLTVAVAAAWIWALPAAPVTQPIAFNHARHQALSCAVCHQGVESAAHAGLPDGTLCAKCHTTAPGGVTTDALDRDRPRPTSGLGAGHTCPTMSGSPINATRCSANWNARRAMPTSASERRRRAWRPFV